MTGEPTHSAWRGRRGLVVLLAQACLVGVALGGLLPVVLPPQCYKQDLQVDYLSARALCDGVDIFTPVTELSARYFPTPTSNFPHPNPHPPVLALFAVPLTLLPFPVVAAVWLACNVGLLFVIGRWLGWSPLARLALAAWPPLWWDLFIGQYELLILATTMLAWRAAAREHDWWAGAWLGLAAVIKLYPVLFLMPFAARRRWRVLGAAVAVLLLGQVGSLAAAGPAGLVRYYSDILPAVSSHYSRIVLNSSVYGALMRIFGGASDVTPLIHAPEIVLPLVLLVSAVALVALARLEPEAAPVAALVALPSVWYYSVVLALPQLAGLVRSIRYRRVAIVLGVGSSFAWPMVNLAVQNVGAYLPPVSVLLAVQPVSLMVLLALSRSAFPPHGGR